MPERVETPVKDASKTAHMAKLRELIAQVEVGWRVEVTDCDYVTNSHVSVVSRLSNNMDGSGRPGYRSRDPRTRTDYYYCWPNESSNFEFEVDGLTLRIFNPSHAYCRGNRAITHTFVYSPPTD